MYQEKAVKSGDNAVKLIRRLTRCGVIQAAQPTMPEGVARVDSLGVGCGEAVRGPFGQPLLRVNAYERTAVLGSVRTEPPNRGAAKDPPSRVAERVRIGWTVEAC